MSKFERPLFSIAAVQIGRKHQFLGAANGQKQTSQHGKTPSVSLVLTMAERRKNACSQQHNLCLELPR
jgi:hypothetical protein